MSQYVQAVNRIAARAGIEIRRKPQALVRSGQNELHFSLEILASHVAAKIRRRPLSLVQIGAFDGVSNDPLVGLLRENVWQAVLVEPQPRPFAALAALYADRPTVQTFNVAIGDRGDVRTLFYLDADDDLPDWAPQLASFSRAHLANSQKYMPGVSIEDRLRQIEVPTWTPSMLIDRAGIERIDLLQIDTEGYDYEVLKLFDLKTRLPAIVGYEHQHLSRADRNAAANLLTRLGYQLSMNYGGGDTLAYRAHPD